MMTKNSRLRWLEGRKARRADKTQPTVLRSKTRTRAATLVLLALFARASVLPGQESPQQDQGFFGPGSTNANVIDGAKNPELIPDVNRWGEFKRMVIAASKTNQPLGVTITPIKEKLDSLLATKLTEVASLAIKCDQEMSKLDEDYIRLTQPFALDNQQVISQQQIEILRNLDEQGWALTRTFKQEVLKLFDSQKRAQVEEFVNTEVTKRIKFYKLPEKL
jgi:hypothetical protein